MRKPKTTMKPMPKTAMKPLPKPSIETQRRIENLLPLGPREDFAALIGAGIPGAAHVAGEIVKTCEDWPTLFGALLFHNCTGCELWCAYKDRHGKDLTALVETIRRNVKP
jgi:hypothetical protein